MDEKDVEIIGCDTLYQGHVRLSEYRLRHRLFSGGWSDEISREILYRGNASVVLPYDPVRDEIVLIEQFRASALEAGEPPRQLEAVAGAIPAGESEKDVAHRELREEAGLTARELHFVSKALSTSGLCSEVVWIYCGIVDASDVGGVHGLDSEHEDIRAGAHTYDAARRLLLDGRIQHLPAVTAFYWLELNRDRLRRDAANMEGKQPK